MTAGRPYVAVHDGLRVPWVTKWSGEVSELQRVQLVTEPGRGPQVVVQPGGPAARDAQGAMWFLDGAGRGGTPLWSTVHSARHRRAMLRPCCQVCGVALPARDIPWLFSEEEWGALVKLGFITSTAPTCRACWDVAARSCPHLAGQPTVRAIVGEAVPWGVVGDLYRPDGSIAERRDQVPLGHPRLRLTLAKQLIMRLHGTRAVR